MLTFLIPLSLAANAVIGSASITAGTTNGDVSVEPGLWSWSHETMLFEIPINEQNTECLTSEMASMSLDDLAHNLDEGCSVSQKSVKGDVTSFTLSCTGRYSGEATGSLTKLSDQEIKMTANGKVSLTEEISAPFSFNAHAKREGSCS